MAEGRLVPAGCAHVAGGWWFGQRPAQNTPARQPCLTGVPSPGLGPGPPEWEGWTVPTGQQEHWDPRGRAPRRWEPRSSAPRR